MTAGSGTRGQFRAARFGAALCFLGILLFAPQPRAAEPLTLAVGGQALFYYLPLTLAERLGYFEDAGLQVDIVDFPGGSKALQALIGGSAQVVAGAFEHVVQMQAKGQALKAFVLLARYPAIGLALRPDRADRWQSPADLKGLKVGVTAPGSSTHFFLGTLLARAGVSPDEVPVIGVGAGAGAVAAMRRGAIDALVHLDPVLGELEAEGAARVVVDTRTREGALSVYGGNYHAACLYARLAWLKKHPQAARALATAQLRALRWLAAASVEDVMQVVPEAWWSRRTDAWRAAFARNRSIWSEDGVLDEAGAANVIRTLALLGVATGGTAPSPAQLIDGRWIAPRDVP